MFRKLGLLTGAVVLAVASGCIADHKYGCDTTTTVSPGAAEGDVFATHGCPDQVIEIGNAVQPGLKHWNKYIVAYRIGEGHVLVGPILQSDKFANIAYLIENGKVVSGGLVPEGEGKMILGPLKWAKHPKARVGYGGDFGYPGSYGQEGRTGWAITGQNGRDNYNGGGTNFSIFGTK